MRCAWCEVRRGPRIFADNCRRGNWRANGPKCGVRTFTWLDGRRRWGSAHGAVNSDAPKLGTAFELSAVFFCILLAGGLVRALGCSRGVGVLHGCAPRKLEIESTAEYLISLVVYLFCMHKRRVFMVAGVHDCNEGFVGVYVVYVCVHIFPLTLI